MAPPRLETKLRACFCVKIDPPTEPGSGSVLRCRVSYLTSILVDKQHMYQATAPSYCNSVQHPPSFTLVRCGSSSHFSCCRADHLRASGNRRGVAVKSHARPIGRYFTCRPLAASFPSSRYMLASPYLQGVGWGYDFAGVLIEFRKPQPCGVARPGVCGARCRVMSCHDTCALHMVSFSTVFGQWNTCSKMELRNLVNIDPDGVERALDAQVCY